MERLIQTSEASIIYGNFKGEANQELFRCPRELDNVDIPRYVNEHRVLVCPMGSEIPFDNDDAEDLSGAKDYWRMYFRHDVKRAMMYNCHSPVPSGMRPMLSQRSSCSR